MSTDIERAAVRLPSDHRIGQATAVEASRAIAEVQAAVMMAMQNPRDEQVARGRMQRACDSIRMAERAFYSFRRSNQTVAGPSIHLARELARCWGNVQYGVNELRRDDAYGQSEMQAWAWDMETNARTSTTFIVPHRRDTKDGPKVLTDMRDIYESNANNGARRVRECIFAVLPRAFTDEAEELAHARLENGDGSRTLDQRIDDCVAGFKAIGVTADQLEANVGRPRGKWAAQDIAKLGVTYSSIQRGELARDDEFPPTRTTKDDITAAAPKPAATRPTAQTEEPSEQEQADLLDAAREREEATQQ